MTWIDGINNRCRRSVGAEGSFWTWRWKGLAWQGEEREMEVVKERSHRAMWA